MSGAHIFLVGFMGAGKSTVGRLIADRLGLPFIDLDERITVGAAASASEIFERHGEARFREIESEALLALDGAPPSVVACGGGIVVRAENRSVLKRLGTVVYLQVSAGEAIARIGDVSSRPLLAGPGGAIAATALLSARESLYASVADVTVDTTGAEAGDVAASVLAALDVAQ